MSLYNLLFGTCPAAEQLLAMVGTRMEDVPRFRDCFLNGEHIVIYTRTGGGNRPAYEEQNAALRALPGFIEDVDDAYDRTFAHFRYAVAPVYEGQVEILRALEGVVRDPPTAWRELIEKMHDPAKAHDPEVVEAMRKGKVITDQILAASAEGGGGVKIIEV